MAGGLIYLRLRKSENWSSPWQTYLPVSVVYLLLNLFLVVTPFIPPNSDWNADGYPYLAFPLVGTGVLLLGVVYWLLWIWVWPRGSGSGWKGEGGEEEDDGKLLREEEPLLARRDSRGSGYDSIDS